jgi:hypothetical protein
MALLLVALQSLRIGRLEVFTSRRLDLDLKAAGAILGAEADSGRSVLAIVMGRFARGVHYGWL